MVDYFNFIINLFGYAQYLAIVIIPIIIASHIAFRFEPTVLSTLSFIFFILLGLANLFYIIETLRGNL